MHRQQLRINRIASISERRKFTKRLIQKINLKLANGWNPLAEQDNTKTVKLMPKAINSFMDDKRNMRPDTLRAYNNFLKIFNTFCEQKFNKDVYILMIDKSVATEYMEFVWKKNISAVRYNNYLGFQILFFNWLIDHGYTKVNPYKLIKKKPATQKTRIMDIDPRDRRKINDYLITHNKQYLLMVFLAFHSLLRPKEITFLKKEHFNTKKQYVFIEGCFSKNKNNRCASIPDVMIDLTKELLKDVRKNEHVFSKILYLERPRYHVGILVNTGKT